MWHLQCDMKQKPSSSPQMKNDNGERALFSTLLKKGREWRERERQREKILVKGKLGTPKQPVCLPALLEVIIFYWTCTWWYWIPLATSVNPEHPRHHSPKTMERDSCRSWSFWIEDMFEEYLRNLFILHTWELIPEWCNSKRYESAHVKQSTHIDSVYPCWIPKLCIISWPSSILTNDFGMADRTALSESERPRAGEGLALKICPRFP